MREGFNPNKGKRIPQNDFYHQVIIPVHIPNLEGYFKSSLQILDYCIDSLVKTSHNQTFVSIVNNGSCKEVKNYLNELLANTKVHEVIHTEAIGKVNAVLKGVVGHQFKMVTISDADVLFLNSWQASSYEVFNSFPKTGVVCTTPSSKSYKTLVSNVYWDTFFSSKLRFRKVKNSEALKAFAHSIGNKDFYSESHLKSYLTIKKENITAVIGSGHFVATYRGDIFNELAQTHSEYSLGANSLHELLDKPVVKKGYWRLSTEDNYTYHMGNVVESWMQETIDSLKSDNVNRDVPELSKSHTKSKISYLIKTKYFGKLIMNSSVLRWFLGRKGLEKKSIKEYTSW